MNTGPLRRPTLVLGTLHVLLVLACIRIYDCRQVFDSLRYLAVAEEFFSLRWEFSPLLNCHTAPGYPLFLALTKVITGYDQYMIALVQSVLFVLGSAYFLRAIAARHALGTGAYTLALGTFLLCPEFIHMDASTLTESLCASSILFIVGAVANDLQRRRDRWLASVALVLLVFVKFEYAFVPVLLVPYLIRARRMRYLWINVALLALCFTANGYRNYRTFGVFNALSFGGGSVIYGGNNLHGDGSWHIQGRTAGYVPAAATATLDSAKALGPRCFCLTQDTLYKHLAKDAWKVAPGLQLRTIPLKVAKLWLITGTLDLYTGQKTIIGGLQLATYFSDTEWPWYGKWKHGAYFLVYWCYLSLGLAGFLVKVRRHGIDGTDVLCLSVLVLTTLIYGVAFYGLARFHLPVLALWVHYVLFLFQRLIERRARTRTRPDILH